MRFLRPAAIVLVTLALAVTLGAFAIHTLLKDAESPPANEYCAVGPYTLDTSQAAVASTMTGVVLTRGLPERAAVLALAAAMQESKLTNIPSGEGDRDSVGVLQQRPSQGWGTVAQLSDLRYATGAFLDALLKDPSWQSEPLATAIQNVQRSADASAYAPHEPEAQALADALTGHQPQGLTCTFPTPTLVAPTATVAAQLRLDLPVNPPTTTTTTLSVPGASWATAAWLVANGDRLGIDSVAYDGQLWTRTKTWRADRGASAAQVVATMHKLS